MAVQRLEVNLKENGRSRNEISFAKLLVSLPSFALQYLQEEGLHVPLMCFSFGHPRMLCFRSPQNEHTIPFFGLPPACLEVGPIRAVRYLRRR